MYSELLSLFNLRTTEECHYSVLKSQGPFEIRFYPRTVCAKVSLSGKFEDVLKEGMKYLEDYLEGNNFQVSRVERRGSFFHVHRSHSFEVGLLLPSAPNAGSVPRPINHVVKISELSPGRVGVLRFNGHENLDTYLKRLEELKKWLNRKGLKYSDPFRIMRNEHLIPLPLIRQHEVHLELY